MMRIFVLLLLATGSLCHAAEITIAGPEKPIQPGRMVRLTIRGITDAELLGSNATVTPPVGVSTDDIDIFPGKSWQNIPYVDFSAQKPGKYLISVGVNRWSESLTAALDAATKAKIEAELLKELQVSVTKISGKYPAKAGQIVVEVAGKPVIPPTDPPTDPDDPPDTNPKKIDRVTYIFEKDQNNVPRPVSFALQRLNAEYKDVVATEFEEDTVDGAGEVPEQYKIALEAARKAGLPALVIQAGKTVVKVVKAPTTEAGVMDEVLK